MDIDLEKIEDKGVGLIQEMLSNFPLEVKYAPNKGRYVVASRDINAGEVIMRALPFSASVQDHLKTFVCNNCYKYRPDNKYNLRCVKCNEVWFCSDLCYQSMQKEHEDFECKYFKRMRGLTTEFDTDQWTETRATLTSVTKLARLIEMNSTTSSSSTSSAEIEEMEEKLEALKIVENGSSSESSTTQTSSPSPVPPPAIPIESKAFRQDIPSDFLVLVGNYEYMSEAQKEYMVQIEQVISKVLRKVEQKNFETGIFSKFTPSVILSLMSKQRCNRFGI
eukprot:TRINITY_DN1521_c0_g1_i4.p1 TRINITY_DN1521_c0_g1~~TRINITY_DN1521_c0_g1_i4.p1  ORF type:complete len:278 (-),score=51.38 TRINITY_DN1521_c0_g1_i4:677-1510(-)